MKPHPRIRKTMKWGGAVVTENVLAWPGIGRLVVMSVSSRDVPMVVASVIVTSALFIAVNLLVDVLYVYADPRVQLGND